MSPRVRLGQIAAEAKEFDAELEKAVATYVIGLEELADWCHTNQAYAQRNLALESLLHYRPDHAKARRYLRYRFDRKADEWVRRSNFHPPADGSAEERETYTRRREALDRALSGEAIEAVERHAEDLGVARIYAEFRDLAEVIPHDARLLDRLGYVKRSSGGEKAGEWVTTLTQQTPARRAQMTEWIEAARTEAEQIVEADLDDVDRAVNLDWQYVLRSNRIRMVARADKDETEDALRAAATCAGFMKRLVGEKPGADYGWTIYLLESSFDMNRFIASYPDLDEDQRTRARSLGSLWLPGKTRCGVWGSDRATRIDMSCKQVAVRFVDTQFGVKPKRGWLVDALGLYINQNLVGTRISRHVTITDYVKPGEVPLTRGLEDPDADWLEIAERCLGAFTDQEFARALGRDTNEMTPEDVVVGYALVACLCEAAGPEALRFVLEQVGSESSSSVAALERWFELPLPEIKHRLRAWLQELPTVAAQSH
ncbi:hypothetical protein Poly30_39740 [Planctomycetes bacterium Poly30]|uniref:Uncharacterized protein n=1 Tax=Saltatorellus ferox TaxID=2528018 RepID=A0A518EWK3_9BACT|nr:hypothetical protein Poly30_39740 [Planctomycetes bacterium Poly30]